MPANAINARFVREYLGGQWCYPPAVPIKPFTNQTIIVTGSNTGMGLEAARHFVRLDAAKVIIAARSLAKGQQAVDDISASTKRPGVAEAWELDLASYASVEAFARRANALSRLDVVVANAGVFMYKFERAEGDELTITVNVVSHMLLALLVLPKLRETAVATGKPSTFTFNGSFTHWMTPFEERKEPNIFEALNDEAKAEMGEPRYQVSKMIQLLTARQFAEELTKSTKPGKVLTSVINPGFVKTSIMRHSSPMFQVYVKSLAAVMSRTPEVGGRMLVLAAEGDEAMHGQYLCDGKIAQPSEWVISEESRPVQEQLWRELTAKLEGIHPGIMGNL
ncbi:hypothetical protein QBC39DRAFT_123285 [Podospora conica]|nr:hypothetical protein QBC39DRAFT_123285 [Schizothecium conicum]